MNNTPIIVLPSESIDFKKVKSKTNVKDKYAYISTRYDCKPLLLRLSNGFIEAKVLWLKNSKYPNKMNSVTICFNEPEDSDIITRYKDFIKHQFDQGKASKVIHEKVEYESLYDITFKYENGNRKFEDTEGYGVSVRCKGNFDVDTKANAKFSMVDVILVEDVTGNEKLLSKEESCNYMESIVKLITESETGDEGKLLCQMDVSIETTVAMEGGKIKSRLFDDVTQIYSYDSESYFCSMKLKTLRVKVNSLDAY